MESVKLRSLPGPAASLPAPGSSCGRRYSDCQIYSCTRRRIGASQIVRKQRRPAQELLITEMKHIDLFDCNVLQHCSSRVHSIGASLISQKYQYEHKVS